MKHACETALFLLWLHHDLFKQSKINALNSTNDSKRPSHRRDVRHLVRSN